MVPILYVNQCAGCHVKDLQFDKRFDQAAPHDKPEVVQAFLVQKYSDYFASHPGALSEAVAPERILPGTLKYDSAGSAHPAGMDRSAGHAGRSTAIR